MRDGPLEFVVTNAPELGFNLVQEAWLGNRIVATVRRVDEKWTVIFFPEGRYCELPWQTLAEIYQRFVLFIQEQDRIPEEETQSGVTG